MKATCFWLDGFEPLVPTTPNEIGRHPACWLQPPGPDRWKDRSRTYPGIADAMASQFSGQMDKNQSTACFSAQKTSPQTGFHQNGAGDSWKEPAIAGDFAKPQALFRESAP